EVAELSEDEAQARLLELLRASIEKRMMADVPFGVFLSGGVDSSTNVALMSELMTDPVRTFSVAFHDYDRYNELEYAREIAARFRRRVWEPLQHLPAPVRRGAATAVTGLARRLGRGEVHALQVAEAAAGRLSFWGGAICYQGALKDRVLSANGRAIPDSYEI